MPDPVITPVNSVQTNISPVNSEARTPAQQAVYDAIVAQPTSPGSTGAHNFAQAVANSGLSSEEVDALIDTYHANVADAGGFEAFHHGSEASAQLEAAIQAGQSPEAFQQQLSGFVSARTGVLDLVREGNLSHGPGGTQHLPAGAGPAPAGRGHRGARRVFLHHRGRRSVRRRRGPEDISRARSRDKQQWAASQPAQSAALDTGAPESVDSPADGVSQSPAKTQGPAPGTTGAWRGHWTKMRATR